MMKDAKWPHAVSSAGGRRGPPASSSNAGASYTLLASSPPSSVRNDGCSPHYPPAPASDDDGLSSFDASVAAAKLPFQQLHRNRPQLGVADWLPLQRQSSGSSVGGDDGEVSSTVSFTIANAAEYRYKGDADRAPSSSSKSWAQQAEEAYNLQLALALRLCSEASAAADPNFLDSSIAAADHFQPIASPQSLSHRFWVCTFSLSYSYLYSYRRPSLPEMWRIYVLSSPSDHCVVRRSMAACPTPTRSRMVSTSSRGWIPSYGRSATICTTEAASPLLSPSRLSIPPILPSRWSS